MQSSRVGSVEEAAEVIGPVFKLAGSLIRGVARLDPTSIIVAAFLLGGASLLVIYGRKHLAKKRRKPDLRRSVKVSDALLHGRYRALTSAFEEAGSPARSTRRRRSTRGERRKSWTSWGWRG